MKGILLRASFLVVICGCGGGKGNDTDSDTSTDATTDSTTDSTTDVVDEEVVDVTEEDVTVSETECASDGDCDDSDPCTADSCDTDTGDCVHDSVDADGDGFLASFVGTDDCGGTDCDDGDDAVFPGSNERRCSEDGDCNGLVDADNDDDGHDSTACGGGDCDDEDADLSPDAEPGCGDDSSDPMSDLDCNGLVDIDNDDDGQYNMVCTDYVTDDCDDTDPDIYYGAPEVCRDGIDQDCDGQVDGLMPLISDVKVSDIELAYTRDLVWSGSEYGLLYDSCYYGLGEIYFQRIDAAGATVGTALRITDGTTGSSSPTLAWTGSEYGLAWLDHADGDGDVRFLRLSGLGTTIGSETWLVQHAFEAVDPTLVWADSQYGLSWRQDQVGDSHVGFARFAADGAPLGTQIHVTGAEAQPGSPFSVWSGSTFGIVWSDERHGAGEIYYGSLDGSGAVVGSHVRLTNDAHDSRFPEIAWTGSEYGLIWRDDMGTEYQISVNRLDRAGNPLASAVQLMTGVVYVDQGSIVWVDGEFVVFWRKYVSSTPYLQFSRLDASLTGFDEMDMTSSGNLFNHVPVSTGSQVGVAWSDLRAGFSDNFFNVLGFCQ